MTNLNGTLFPRERYIGFENLFNDLERIALQNKETYPKHNIVKTGEDSFEIQLAIAGFGKEDLQIELQNSILTVSGQHDDSDVNYIHKGLSTKRFTRSFRLSEYVEIEGADFRNGLLVISLKVVVPENKRPRLIPIGGEDSRELLTEENAG